MNVNDGRIAIFLPSLTGGGAERAMVNLAGAFAGSGFGVDMVLVNTYRAVSYLSPFGGYKHSGLGRESGKEMIKEYLQMKSVWIETSNAEALNPFVLR